MNQIGLGDYCLEVHSTKAQKSAVIEQLKVAWTNRTIATETDWAAATSDLKKKRGRRRAVSSLRHRADRDKLRQAALESLGWRILRIWSTEWWLDPNAAIEKVHQRLLSMLEQDRAAAQQQQEPQPDTPIETPTEPEPVSPEVPPPLDDATPAEALAPPEPEEDKTQIEEVQVGASTPTPSWRCLPSRLRRRPTARAAPPTSFSPTRRGSMTPPIARNCAGWSTMSSPSKAPSILTSWSSASRAPMASSARRTPFEKSSDQPSAAAVTPTSRTTARN
jgi:REase_MTES_1575